MNLTEYLNQSIESLLRDALRNTASNPKESAFFIRSMHVQKKASDIRSRSEKAGRHVPPFLIASIASQCNLHCVGCYARANHACADTASEELPAPRWKKIFLEAAGLGVSFVLLAGGEPLFRKDVLRSASEVPDVIFPVFTNGTMLDEEYLKLFSRSRNLIPVLSVEGDAPETDARRGAGVYRRVADVMKKIKEEGIFYGCSITVTRENLPNITADDFVDRLSANGCKLIFYVEYVPAVPGTEDLAPNDADRGFLADQLKKLRSRRQPILFFSFPGDEKALGGCLAAGRGFFHINARGGAEPCPFSPYSDIGLKEHTLAEAMDSPLFYGIQKNGLTDIPHDGGCALFAKQDAVRDILKGQEGK